MLSGRQQKPSGCDLVIATLTANADAILCYFYARAMLSSVADRVHVCLALASQVEEDVAASACIIPTG